MPVMNEKYNMYSQIFSNIYLSSGLKYFLRNNCGNIKHFTTSANSLNIISTFGAFLVLFQIKRKNYSDVKRSGVSQCCLQRFQLSAMFI